MNNKPRLPIFKPLLYRKEAWYSDRAHELQRLIPMTLADLDKELGAVEHWREFLLKYRPLLEQLESKKPRI